MRGGVGRGGGSGGRIARLHVSGSVRRLLGGMVGLREGGRGLEGAGGDGLEGGNPNGRRRVRLVGALELDRLQVLDGHSWRSLPHGLLAIGGVGMG